MVFDFIRVGSVPLRSDRHLLAGTIIIDNQPGVRLVCVFARQSQFLEAARWSQPDGTFVLSGLPQYPERALMVVAYDTDMPAGTGKFNVALRCLVWN